MQSLVPCILQISMQRNSEGSMCAFLGGKVYTGLICIERPDRLDLAWNKNKVSVEAYEIHGFSFANILYLQIFL